MNQVNPDKIQNLGERNGHRILDLTKKNWDGLSHIKEKLVFPSGVSQGILNTVNQEDMLSSW